MVGILNTIIVIVGVAIVAYAVGIGVFAGVGWEGIVTIECAVVVIVGVAGIALAIAIRIRLRGIQRCGAIVVHLPHRHHLDRCPTTAEGTAIAGDAVQPPATKEFFVML